MSKFLEPIHLNEKMVLNCAAYLWKGVSTESEVTEETATKIAGGGSFGIPILQRFLSPVSVSGSGERVRRGTSKAARRYTLGGLHMSVLDELRNRSMIESTSASELINLDPEKTSYVDVIAILRPIDFYAILDTLKVLAPLGFQLFRDYGQKLTKATKGSPQLQKLSELQRSSTQYEKSLADLITRLEQDYQTSKQLEMVMWNPEKNIPFGLVDLDTSDVPPAEVKARVTGIRAHVIGKISSKVSSGESMGLMQRTVLSGLFEIVERLACLPDDPNAIVKYKSGMEVARTMAEKVCTLAIPGPAVRLAAMSVCI